MTLSDKIKALMTLKGKKTHELAERFDVTPQSMRNKMSRNTYSAADLIEIVDFLGAKLVIEVDDNVKIVITKDDV